MDTSNEGWSKSTSGASTAPLARTVSRHVASQATARFLFESEVNAAVNARVVDVVGDLLERRVVQADAEYRWRRGSHLR
jgi:hypothetical protein